MKYENIGYSETRSTLFYFQFCHILTDSVMCVDYIKYLLYIGHKEMGDLNGKIRKYSFTVPNSPEYDKIRLN